MENLVHLPAATRALLAESREQERLDLAALAVASLELEVDRGAVEQALASLAARVREGQEADALERLVRVLAVEEGYCGDTERYDAPENSFLPRVLERRRGLPILLSVLYVEVARRAGVPLYAVNFPGHVLVAAPSAGFPRVRDPFHAGHAVSEDGCAALLRRMAPHLPFSAALLEPADCCTLTARMLHNLRRYYVREKDLPRAVRVVTMLLELLPDHPAELRARAALLASMGASKAALADLERCLEIHPDCPDNAELERAVEKLRARTCGLH